MNINFINQVTCGDSVQLVKELDDNSLDLVITSPPYNVDLGNNKLQSLSMGKWFIIECDDDFDIKSLCEKLLANTVIERYDVKTIIKG